MKIEHPGPLTLADQDIAIQKARTVCVRMYLCMCVCMYVYMYVCMCVYACM